jgi:hypothetical protein
MANEALKRNRTYDSLLELQDSAAITTTVAGKVGGVAKVVDVGAALFEGDAIIDISAITCTTDQLYTIKIQGTNTAAFASTDIVDLVILNVGAGEVLAAATAAVDTPTGRTILPFNNEQSGTVYRYLRVYFITTGDAESITLTIRAGKRG